MASFLSKAWFQEELGALRERAATWPMPWQCKMINSLLYLREHPETGCVGVYRQTDNQLILSMTDTGDIKPHHHGFWEPEFALAVGEALILIGRIHQERVRLTQERKPGEALVPFSLPKPEGPELERSLAMEAFFDIVDSTSAEIVSGAISADLWESSRDRYDDCIRWANEFERVHAETDWADSRDESDYFIAIEDFTRAKLAELSKQ